MPRWFWSLLGVVAAAASLAAAGQRNPAAITLPQTLWGDPDLQGTWIYATMTPLERPRDFGDKATLTDDEAAAYEKQTNDPRAAARAQTRRLADTPENVEELGLNVRCLNWSTAGPPMLPGVYNNTVQFVQTRDFVVIVNEMIHEGRIVPMNGAPHGTIRRWMGDSRGRWDGRTLVVDTIGFTDKTSFRGADESLHLVERFTRLDAKTIEYRFTVDDPTVWTRPWTASFPLRGTDDRMYEYACHEGNERSLEGIFRAARISRGGR
ncbi:MAG: hypothetical protein AUI11_02815 [Acidobacteria bacterium 13_2_20CM_2_66_4]|nr:MAG: hypothetical protein AUI11_02815 [Acidobacteria bacterium 13_2_20CM_2_66_4]